MFDRPPYSNVQVAVGPGGVPGDVGVVCLSRLAREGGISESRVEAKLRAEGRFLLSPDDFVSVLDQLESLVMAGTLALPVPPNQLPQPPTERSGTAA